MIGKRESGTVTVRLSEEMLGTLNALAAQRNLTRSELIRDLISEALETQGSAVKPNHLYEIVRAAVEEILKPGIERLAAISAKATQLDAASFFMFLYSMQRDGSPEEQERIQQAMSDARRLGIQYLKVKDKDIDRFLRVGSQQIGEDN